MDFIDDNKKPQGIHKNIQRRINEELWIKTENNVRISIGPDETLRSFLTMKKTQSFLT